MVLFSFSSAVGGRNFSTVVPATVTGEDSKYELNNVDLAMKLHYLKGVYYFKQGSGVDTKLLKEPMFRLLQTYFPVSGRIRCHEHTGRPYVKCNDSGVRIVEATCDVSLEEWLRVDDVDSRHKELVPQQFIGCNSLHFSPLVLIQFTWFRGGGFALGLSWSHVLGDAASAVNFINQYGQFLGGKNNNDSSMQLKSNKSKHQLEPFSSESAKTSSSLHAKGPVLPLSLEHVDAVLDHKNRWVLPDQHNMETFSFKITKSTLDDLQRLLIDHHDSVVAVPPFVVVSALMWQAIAKVREEKGNKQPTTITICTPDAGPGVIITMGNHQSVRTVAVGQDHNPPSQTQLADLVKLMVDSAEGEDYCFEHVASNEEGEENGSPPPDMILYGANLTFVDMEKVEFYGLELKGQKPVLVEYSIDGVGNEGAVLVLPFPEGVDGDDDQGDSNGSNGGRMVTVILPKQQLPQLRQELRASWGVVA